jgi:hypothetical protein
VQFAILFNHFPFLLRVVTDSRAYYAVQDVIYLERGELIDPHSYIRKMVLKATEYGLFLALLMVLSMVKGCRGEEPWTPNDFNWSALTVAPREKWAGLYLNLTKDPLPAHTAMMELGKPSTLSEDSVLLIPFAVGIAIQGLELAVNLGSAVTAVQGCATSDGSAGSIAGCVFGIAGTLFGIGAAVKLANKNSWLEAASNTWDYSNGDAALRAYQTQFRRRSQEVRQKTHEGIMADVLREAGLGEPEFLGYTGEDHTLSARDEDHLHPRAPIFRVLHPTQGLIDIASREHVNATRFTVSFANHGLEKRQSFQHERLSGHLIEARFDGDAAQADPADPSFNAAGGYDHIEGQIKKYGTAEWPGNSVMSMQFYDTTAKSTFGFGSLGIFENGYANGALEALKPRGMPL